MKEFDLLVIGGGPGGYSAAISAAKQGLSVALFEKKRIGGTCLNVGCIPTKYLLDKASAIEKVNALVKAGIFQDSCVFDFEKLQSGKAETVAKLVSGVEYLLKANKVTVVEGEAVLCADKVVRVCNSATDEPYKGKAVIIATGSKPAMPKIPGIEYCLDSTGVLALEKVPSRFVVIGGGVVGLELASAFASFGSEVTVVEMLPAILSTEQPEAARMLSFYLKKRGVTLKVGARVKAVIKAEETVVASNPTSPLTVQIEEKGKELLLPASAVLVVVGRTPCLDGLDAEKLGLEMDGRFIKVDSHLETNLKGVYAIGDVRGGYQLAHAAYAEAEVAVKNILPAVSRPANSVIEATLDTSVLPRCIYTMPGFAAVGLTSQQAKDQGFEPVVGSFSYDANGMALAEGAKGSVYVIMDKENKKTLGVQIVGENACELICSASFAVAQGTTLEQWESLIVAHPSLSEMLKEAALDAFGLAVHKK